MNKIEIGEVISKLRKEKALILCLSYIEKYNLNYNLKFRLAVLIKIIEEKL